MIEGGQMSVTARSNNLPLREVQEYLAKNGIKMTEEELMDIIIRFSIKNKYKLLETVKKDRNKSDKMLDEWLATPIETEKTDAVADHNLVI